MPQSFSLSNRAIQMLSKNSRNLKEQPRTASEIETLLKQKGCSLSHPILPFQLELGGYLIPDIHSTSAIRLGMTYRSGISFLNNQWLCEFGFYEGEEGKTIGAPGELVMDERGALFLSDYTCPIASSIQVYLESHSIVELLSERKDLRLLSGSGENLIIKNSKLIILNQILIAKDFVVVTEATDAFNHWWIGSDSIVEASLPWEGDGSEFEVWIYANSHVEPKMFIDTFQGLT